MTMNVVHVELGERSYSIHIGDGAWDLLQENLREWNSAGKIMVVTDERVHSIYGHRIEGLTKALKSPFTVVVPQGEKSKSFGRLEDLCRKMAGAGLDRGSLVVALGGGVVGDLAGLAASIYLRGVSVIQVPTTLLSMVDSSTGGKTGINLPEGKNQVGTFHQPQGVYANTDVLRTLESRDWYSGMAEIVKISLTLDPELFAYLEKVNDLGPEGGVDIQLIVEAACRRKAEVISIDEKEAGPRLVLNFGHTLAHALESSLGLGEIRHGEAVAIGMRAALSLSKQICGLDEGQYRRAMAVIEKIPVPDIRYDQNLVQFLTRDKKRIGGRVRCVLLEDIGRCHVTSLDDPGELVKALALS